MVASEAGENELRPGDQYFSTNWLTAACYTKERSIPSAYYVPVQTDDYFDCIGTTGVTISKAGLAIPRTPEEAHFKGDTL